MRPLSAIAIAAGIMLGAPANAQPVRPWCEYGAMFGAAPDCSFATLAQCIAMARGDGTCGRNPAFEWAYRRRGLTPPTDTDYYGRALPKSRGH